MAPIFLIIIKCIFDFIFDVKTSAKSQSVSKHFNVNTTKINKKDLF